MSNTAGVNIAINQATTLKMLLQGNQDIAWKNYQTILFKNNKEIKRLNDLRKKKIDRIKKLKSKANNASKLWQREKAEGCRLKIQDLNEEIELILIRLATLRAEINEVKSKHTQARNEYIKAKNSLETLTKKYLSKK